MAIKKAKNGKALEFLTIKIPSGFTAYELAHYLMVDEGTLDDQGVNNILAIHSYPTLMKKVKTAILDFGLETPQYRVGDNWQGNMNLDEALKTVADHIVMCSGNKPVGETNLIYLAEV